MSQEMQRVILESAYAPKVAKDASAPGLVISLRDMVAKLFGRPTAAESRFKAKWDQELHWNVTYARLAMNDCLRNHGQAPMASHLLYTQDNVLDDTVPEERTLGIDAGLEWRKATTTSVVYVDRSVSAGMAYGIAKAQQDGKDIIVRRLPRDLLAKHGIPVLPIAPEVVDQLSAVGIDVSEGDDADFAKAV